jgi:hypothetical protein
VAAETAKRRRILVAQSIETRASHADLDALAAALAERLHLQNGSPWMSTAACDFLALLVEEHDPDIAPRHVALRGVVPPLEERRVAREAAPQDDRPELHAGRQQTGGRGAVGASR